MDRVLTQRKALLLRHVAFEDAGTLAEALERSGFRLQYVEAGTQSLRGVDADADLLVILGGPISVNGVEDFPFLQEALALVKARLAADLPTLGICLGAQLMAVALGARVFRGPRKEIGWSPLALTPEGRDSVLRHLEGVPVLHWHGETFELPGGVRSLAATPGYPNQAFRWGRRGLALQFHPEVMAEEGLERWFIGHIEEISATPGISVQQLRRDTALHAPTLPPRAAALWRSWLAEVGLGEPHTR